MPNGDFLVAELANRVRIVRGGDLAPQPLTGWPAAGVAADWPDAEAGATELEAA